MTNKEKAVEIADNAKRQKYFDDRCNDLAGNIVYQSAMIMAEWKDAQFKEYLEKKKEDYLSARDNAAMWTEQWTVYHALACTMHQIINELFGGK